MNTMSRLVALSLFVFLLLPSGVMAAKYKKQTIMGATANPSVGQHGAFLNKFKEIVEKESDGAITVKLFFSGSMGDEVTNVKQLRNSELQIASVFTGNLTSNAPSAMVLGLPYMFDSKEDAYALFRDKGFTDDLAEKIIKEANVRPLAWITGGFRNITNSKHPIKSINDLQGLKIRVSPSAVQLAAFRAWGIEPHPMAWSETYNALQQGVIDGQENPYVAITDLKMWEIQKYVTEIHYMFWTGAVLASVDWFKKLDPDTRALVEKAAREAQEVEWVASAKIEEDGKEASLKHGMEIFAPSDEPVWKEKAQAIWKDFLKTPESQALADKAVSVIKAAKK
ncbi:Taurine transporter periplasmatic component [Deltaproteobacteria bacterium]|nr:Taurine transporter periplasmatic component [Deltaproteobacteria bacterium]